MVIMYNEGSAEYIMAQQLKELHIHGSFTSITRPGLQAQRAQRLAYFSGNPLYSIPIPGAAHKDVLREMRRYHVTYYFAYHDGNAGSNFTDESGKPFPEVTGGVINGLKVFLVNP